jgi:predicted transcriptional regulator
MYDATMRLLQDMEDRKDKQKKKKAKSRKVRGFELQTTISSELVSLEVQSRNQITMRTPVR